MITSAHKDLCRTSALLLMSVVVAGGCGSSASQRSSPRQTVSPAVSTTASPAASSTRRSHKISRTGGRSGVTGQAVASVCGALPAGKQTCPRRPVLATIRVVQRPSGQEVAVIHTDPAGRFRLNLAPGAYELFSRTSGYFLYARPVILRVRSHQIARTLVSFAPRHPLPIAHIAAGGSVRGADPRATLP